MRTEAEARQEPTLPAPPPQEDKLCYSGERQRTVGTGRPKQQPADENNPNKPAAPGGGALGKA